MARLNFQIQNTNDRSIIKVFGIGGGGGNAVNYMFNQGIRGVEFVVCNTDNQALEMSPIESKIQIGDSLTGGRGVGGNPEVGKKAAMEDIDQIKAAIGDQTKMVFITTGMGGGTGTGAAPVIAQVAKEMDILTVGIVTYPFTFEGEKRKKVAEEGIEILKKHVDALIIIHNDKLLDMFKGLVISKAFAHADNVLATAAKGIAEIITVTGIMNVDFEDVKSIMTNSGTALMGSAVMEGEDRGIRAIEAALNSPLLKDKDIKGAKHILLNITYGKKEVQIDELTAITNYIKEQVGHDVDLKFGHCHDDHYENELSVTVIATALEGNSSQDEPESDDFEELYPENEATSTESLEREEKKVFQLDDSQYDDEVSEEQMELNFRSTADPLLKSEMEKQKLQDMSFNIRTAKGLEHAESIPAYIRKKIKLDDVPHSSESEISRLILEDGDDNKPEIKEDNAFLNDNVD